MAVTSHEPAQPVSISTRRTGFWSAVTATVLSLVYIIAQLAEWAGLLGSDGGPHSGSTPLGLGLLLTPSLLLAPAFLILMASIHQIAPPGRRVFSLAALGFAIVYTTLVGIVYYVQLTLVAPRMARGEMAGIELLEFVPFDSFLYSVDLLGYSCMSLSMLMAAGTLTGSGVRKAARWLLYANGLLLPFLAFQIYFPELIWGGALWGITFPAATAALALMFAKTGSSG